VFLKGGNAERMPAATSATLVFRAGNLPDCIGTPAMSDIHKGPQLEKGMRKTVMPPAWLPQPPSRQACQGLKGSEQGLECKVTRWVYILLGTGSINSVMHAASASLRPLQLCLDTGAAGNDATSEGTFARS
jgi:hypothetical protein